RHTFGASHVSVSQIGTQLPSRQTLRVPSSPGGQVTPKQRSSTQKPSTQVSPGGQRKPNSVGMHSTLQRAARHTPPSQRSPSSITPLQSSSSPLQTSVPGSTPPTHWSAPAMQRSVPSSHTPSLMPHAPPSS